MSASILISFQYFSSSSKIKSSQCTRGIDEHSALISKDICIFFFSFFFFYTIHSPHFKLGLEYIVFFIFHFVFLKIHIREGARGARMSTRRSISFTGKLSKLQMLTGGNENTTSRNSKKETKNTEKK